MVAMANHEQLPHHPLCYPEGIHILGFVSMIRFPYGISNFPAIRTEGYLYLDRTQHIPLLEEAGKQLVFLRPRRFGKSLLLSTLANYYDIKTAGQFDTLFGGLEVGRNPTPEHNRYLILRWDFSKVSAQGDIDDIKSSLFNHLNETIETFKRDYAAFLQGNAEIYENALVSFQSLCNNVGSSGQQIYLLIDEYDNFTNEATHELLMQSTSDNQRYQALLEAESIIKVLFKIIKGSAGEGTIGRVFITGVLPLVLADITGGYNIATDISLQPRFHDLCGITIQELDTLVDQVLKQCREGNDQRENLLQTLKRFYNGYRFCDQADTSLLYNPSACLYLHHYQDGYTTPHPMPDNSLMADTPYIHCLMSQSSGTGMLERILNEANPITLDVLVTRFGIGQFTELQQDERYLLSLLYYFGVLTIVDTDILGKPTLGIPNFTARIMWQALQDNITC